jgi:hypothetical protein
MTDDAPTTPDEIVDFARLTAQKRGKVLLPEMIAALDDYLAQRCASARANVNCLGHESAWDWENWGRRTCVLEATVAFLQRISDDPEARDYLVRRFRREVSRGVPVDRQDGREAAASGGAGLEVG